MSPTTSSRRNSQQIVASNVTLPKHPYWLGGPLSNILQNGADSPASVSGSFLDCTASPDKQLDGMYLDGNIINSLIYINFLIKYLLV